MAHIRHLWGGRPSRPALPGERHDVLPGRHTGGPPRARRRLRRGRLLCLVITVPFILTFVLCVLRGPPDGGDGAATMTHTDTALLTDLQMPEPHAAAPAAAAAAAAHTRFHGGAHVSPDALAGMTVKLRDRAKAGLATTLHPLGPHHHAHPSASTATPTLTIFACPKPGAMGSGSANHAALQSWLRLRPKVNVVLFGSAEDETLQSAVAAGDGRVSVETQYDATFRGVPLFNSLIARARQAATTAAMFINADIVLLNDVWPALRRAHRDGPGWLVTGMRVDVADLPFDFATSGDGADFDDRVRAHVRASGRLHSFGGVDYWAWDNTGVLDGRDATASKSTASRPLINGTMPSFVYGRGKYDNWFTHAAIHGGHRRVVDATNVVTAVHVNHKYAHVAGVGDAAVSGGAAGAGVAGAGVAAGSGLAASTTSSSADGGGGLGAAATTSTTTASSSPVVWSARATKQSAYEVFSNIHLAMTAPGGYRNQLGTAHHVPRQLFACEEPAADNVCMVTRVRPGTCPCEYSPFHAATMNKVVDRGGTLVCGHVSEDAAQDYAIPAAPAPGAAPGLPHTLDQLLPHVANELGVVILTGTTFKYHTMLMNFACNLRSLGIHNPLIAAFDEATYRYAFVRGLAVYSVNAAGGGSAAPYTARGGVGPMHGSRSSASADASAVGTDAIATVSAASTTIATPVGVHDCDYGTDCFREVTKLKSRVVLNILRKGYHVLWSDMDVVWLRNPVPSLWAYGPGTLAIQSNSPGVGEPANALRRINSGFYLARSDSDTIRAFELIIRHALASDTTEQPSFYAVLCGEAGQHRMGDTSCTEPLTGLRTVLLPLADYPNGAYGGWWDRPADLRASGVVVLHNNWITGLDHKFERLVRHGMMYIGDDDAMSCRYAWSAGAR